MRWITTGNRGWLWIVVAGGGLAVAACSADVSGPEDAVISAATQELVSTCSRGGVPGALNQAGRAVGPTGTYTNWTWPSELGSMEWELQIENEIASNGYFWSHQFKIAGGDGGYFGVQANGVYQARPPWGRTQSAKMVVFAIAGVALAAELGDIAAPNARTYPSFDGNPGYNIHARYPWQPCRIYRLRVGRESTEPNGNIWYGAWITDTETEIETFIGRILLPATSRAFGTWSSMWTERFGTRMRTCSAQQHASAVFSAPTADDGAIAPISRRNSFATTPNCGNSRFTEFPDAVRQEMGVPP